MSAPPHADGTGEFPCHGARARLILRFERDFTAWLDTPEGRFAVWQAREPCWEQAARLRREQGARTPHGA
jgi:hypothetical protein